MATEQDTTEETSKPLAVTTLVTRSSFGGVLMGLANLVPGISGGTMLLIAGIYPQFINAIADFTKLRFRMASMLVLGAIAASAGLAILLFAGTLKDLVVDHRWVMYSLFIGLTLGGIPLVWRLARPASTSMIVSFLIALGAMGTLAILQAYQVVGNTESNFITLLLAGLAGASAMILPGVSGGYLLLLLGQYVPVLSAIEQFKDALKARDLQAAMDPAFSVLVPVGLGVMIGIVVVGNLLQWLLAKYKKATLGVLLGLLIGSVFGLWPFKNAVQPSVGDKIKGEVVTAESLPTIEKEDWGNEHFTPTVGQVAGSIGLIAVGFGLTLGVASLGGKPDEDS